MDAREKSLTFLVENIRYVIPYFQRSYVWNEENWEELWDELIADRQDCFLGSIILKLEKNTGNSETRKSVIDGQQRLTTLSILLEALCEKIEADPDNADTAKEYRKLLFYHTDIWNVDKGNKVSKTPKIIHSRLDKADYNSVITGEARASVADISKESSGIFRCYKFFTEKIEQATGYQLRTVSRKLLNTESHILVVINLGADENEQAIFDTINSAGVKLTAADMIKNAVYQKMGSDHAALEEHYTENWYPCFEAGEKVQKWLGTKGSGQNQRTYIDLFFQCFAILEGFFDPTKDKIADLAKKYKEYIAMYTMEDAKSFIEKICEYAKTYEEVFIGYDSVTGYTYSKYRHRLMHILTTTKVTVFDAFILYAVRNFTSEQCKAVFKKLETYVMRNYVLSNSKITKSYNQDLKAMVKGNFDFDSALSRSELANERIDHKLRSIDNARAKLILFWIELYQREHNGKSDQHETGLTYNFQLEHIMPQSWRDNWGLDVLPVVVDGEIVDDVSAAETVRSDAVYRIGNMTLLTARLNDQISNSSFADKVNGREIRGRFETGIKQNSSLLITREILSEPLLWNEEKIVDRTDSIIRLFETVWAVPSKE